MIEAFPLHFPKDVQRTKHPIRSKFKTSTLSVHRLTTEIIKEVRLLKGKNLIISSNIQLRKDGLPYSNQNRPRDCGVAVWFTVNNNQRVIACDKYVSVEENLYAITQTVNAMRSIERWGVSEIMDRMFQGFLSLPSEVHWKSVLGLSGVVTKEQLVEAYKKKAKETHPDTGGSSEAFSEVNMAYSQGLKEIS